MGLTAISAVAGSLLSKLEGLHGHKAAKTSDTSAPQFTSTGDASSVSDPGMFFSQLQNLRQQNPAEFKKITAQVAQQLQAAGGSSGSSAPNSALNQMASNFQHASQTGSFSDLFSNSPQTAAQQGSAAAAADHPHHHHYRGGGADDAADASTVNSIFSQALSQIKTDVGSASALRTSSI